MTQQVVRARTIIPSRDPLLDGMSFDTYWEQKGSDTNVNLTVVTGYITTFLSSTVTGQTNSIGSYMDNSLDRSSGVAQIEYYDITAHLNGTPAGSPIGIQSTAVGNAHSGSNPLPAQCSVVVGYRADYGTDVEFGPGTRPRSRDRNRFYLGPMNSTTIQADGTTGAAKLSPFFLADLVPAIEALMTQRSGGTDNNAMVVWSRKNAAVKDIVAAETRSFLATQRRRVDLSPRVSLF